MLWYVAVIAALNLCLGYLWAARTRACPQCARRRATEMLSRRAPTAGATAGRPGSTHAAPPDGAAAKGPAAAAETADAAAEVKPPSAGGALGGLADGAVPDSAVEDAPLEHFFTGLDAYLGELTEVDRQLGESEDNADQVTQCANRLRTANDNFIGVANAAIDQLDAEPNLSRQREASQIKLRETVGGQLKFATARKSELDKLNIAANPKAAQAALRKTTEQLRESTDGLFEEVRACLAAVRAEFEAADQEPQMPTVPRDPATGLVTREHAESLIEQFASADRNEHPVTVALLELDSLESAGSQAADSVDQRLVCGVSNIVRRSLAAHHTAARFADQQLLLLVPHEDVNQAMRRAEEMRQRVASTEFVIDGRAIKATVTCALAQMSAERSGAKLFEFLQEALTEAKRYGGNRTFTHDGNSPSPVVPPELAIAPQQLAI